MGFLDILKKAFGTNKTPIVEEPEKIEFTSLPERLEDKEKENKKKESSVFYQIEDKVKESTKEINEKLEILKAYNLGSKKAEDKFKAMAENGRERYIETLEEFIDKLNSLEEKSFEQLVKNTSKIFSDFEKKSYTSYERATVLIGKEMAAIKEITVGLSKYFKKIFEDNKEIPYSRKTIAFISSRLEEIEEIDKDYKEINRDLEQLDYKLEELKEKSKKKLEEIARIKTTEGYLDNLKQKQKTNTLFEEIEREIYGLKSLIDFKALSSFFHEFENDMVLVKSYKDNFQETFQEDYGKALLRLLDDSKKNTQEMTNKINLIREKKEEADKIKSTIKSDATEPLSLKIAEMNTEIESLNEEKEKNIRAKEKLDSKKKELIDSIKEKSRLLNLLIQNP
ncbi:MAG: hypothetical protein KKB31_01250 [Nanoarchaeota archaeon]|nr:hypothetical protein [Nanoarchaeota archaeon]